MRYGAYSSSEVKSSSDGYVKEKSYSSSSWEISGSFGVGRGDGVLTPSILFGAFCVCVSLMVIESA
jgi:hypothetical protein